MTTTQVSVELATPDQIDAVQQLRRRVFGEERSIDEALDIDGRDCEATHAAAYADGQLVGTGRLMLDGSTGRIGRMAVARQWRSAGIGARILRRLEIAARHAGADEIILQAMDPAYSFYEREGYRREGEEFVVVGHPHWTMRKHLPVLREARDSDAADLIELIGGCFAEYPNCVLDIDNEEPWLRSPASSYARAGGALWVVTDGQGGPVIASGAGKPSTEGRDEVKSMYVAARARRLGLARDLFGQVQAWSAGRGRELHLWTDTRFVEAHQLYESLGFVADGQQRELHDKSHTVEYHYVRGH